MYSLVIVSTADLYYGNSAAVTRMNNYAKALALGGVDVYLLPIDALFFNKQWVMVEPHIFTLQKEGIKSGKGYNPLYAFKVVRMIKRRLKTINGEVVVLNYPSTSSLLIDIFILLFIRRKSVFCELNEVRQYAAGFNNNSMRNRLYHYLLDRTVKWYDGAIFISKNIKDYYLSYVRKFVIVPILSDCRKPFVPSKGLGTLDFVFVGTVSFTKENLGELFEGFCMFAQIHAEARLKMYGAMSQADQDKFHEFVEANNMKSQMYYLGKLPHSEVEEVLSTAGALLLSRSNNKQNYYGFSTKLSEYTVSGTPIIMTNTGVVGDFYQDGVNCLMCDGYDRHAFKQKFDEFFQLSESDKVQIAHNAYMVAKNHFDYRMYSESLMDFFFGVVNA